MERGRKLEREGRENMRDKTKKEIEDYEEMEGEVDMEGM